MITFDGGPGSGYLWCSFRVPVSYGYAYDFRSSTHVEVPPMSFRLPPPDSIWYPTASKHVDQFGEQKTIYGPRLSYLECGELDSEKRQDPSKHPCLHSTVKGHLLLRDSDGSNSPYIPRSTPLALVADSEWELQGIDFLNKAYVQQAVLQPTNNSWNYLIDRFGVLFPRKFYTSPAIKAYYSENTTLFAPYTQPLSQSTLPTGGVMRTHGKWYGAKVDGTRPTTYTESVLHNTEYERPNRTLVKRVYATEVHTTASYTPSDLKNTFDLSTGLGSCYAAVYQTDEIEITHVRSIARGIFQVRLRIRNDWEKDHWNGLNEVIHEAGNQTITRDVYIKVLSPSSSTKTLTLDVDQINLYCSRERARAQWFRDDDAMIEARTAAVNSAYALKSNWIENISSVKETVKIMSPLLLGWRAFKSKDFKLAKRALLEAYLTYMYVISPAIRDYEDIDENLNPILASITTAADTSEVRRGRVLRTLSAAGVDANLSFTCNISLSLKDNPFAQVWNALEKLGLQPTSGQLWDCVPFSFVVDWFFKVGDALTTLDNYASLIVHRYVDYVIEGFKVSWPVQEEEYSLAFGPGSVPSGKPLVYSFYHRIILPEIGQVDVFSIQLGNGLTLSQLCQGTALISLYKK